MLLMMYFLQEQHDGYITFTSTPHGVSTEIPIRTHEGQLLGYLGWIEGGRYLLLLLRTLPSENILPQDRLYRVGGVPLRRVHRFCCTHVVYAPATLNDLMLCKSALMKWRKVYLAYEDVAPHMHSTEDASMLESVLTAPELPSFHRLFYSPFHLELGLHGRVMLRHESQGLLQSFVTGTWTGDPPVVLTMKLHYVSIFTQICLGVCTRLQPVAHHGAGQVVHWAQVTITWHSGAQRGKELEHDCSSDHIARWPDLSRKFGYRITTENNVQVTLSFVRFERDPERTLMLHLDAQPVDALDNDCHILYDHL